MVYSPPKSDGVSNLSNGSGSGKFFVLVNSICKSAGTLIALSADELWMTGNAELGPLDIQLRKPDEVGERTSGLTPVQALLYLQSQSASLFKAHFKALRFDEDLIFSTKMAAELATKLTTGLFGPIYEQVDPFRLAEVNRSLSISSKYGERLQRNLKTDALERLISAYPSHGFVIDREEAKTLFEHVGKPPEYLFAIAEIFKVISNEYLEKDEKFIKFLSESVEVTGGQDADKENGKDNHVPREGVGEELEAGSASATAAKENGEAKRERRSARAPSPRE